MSHAMKVFAVAVIAALAWAGAPAAEAQPPIRIGASLSLTGTYTALGQTRHRGYQLCVKHMNDRGGVLGRKLELVIYDDRSDPATAARLYEQLIAQDGVGLVLGPITSPVTDAVASVTEKHTVSCRWWQPEAREVILKFMQLTIMPAAFVYCHRGVRLGSGEGDGEPQEASGQLP